MGYSFQLTARVLLYAPSHRQDNTYHSLCYNSRGALAGTRNSSMGPLHEGSIRRPITPWANSITTERHLAPYLKKPRVYISWFLYLFFRPETLDWVANLWSRGGRAWTFSGYGHVYSSEPAPPPPNVFFFLFFAIHTGTHMRACTHTHTYYITYIHTYITYTHTLHTYTHVYNTYITHPYIHPLHIHTYTHTHIAGQSVP